MIFGVGFIIFLSRLAHYIIGYFYLYETLLYPFVLVKFYM